VVFCEHDDRPTGSVKDFEFRDRLSAYFLFMLNEILGEKNRSYSPSAGLLELGFDITYKPGRCKPR
jgi:hypothetical protein